MINYTTPQPLIIIAGATASGKSALAYALAKEHHGFIINADAMQLYRGVEIITAQPSRSEQEEIPHRLYGILHPDDPCNVARWLSLILPLLHELWQEGRLPIVVGGTGMYLDALMHGLAIIPDIPAAVRDEVRHTPSDVLWDALCHEDPIMATRLRPSDRQRLSRALEVIRATGHSLSYWHAQPTHSPIPDATIDVRITTLPRAEVYTRINQRVDQMMIHGALREVESLHALALDRALPVMRAVGVRELCDYFDGLISYDDAIERIKRNSRRYAKRQYTWLRHHFTLLAV